MNKRVLIAVAMLAFGPFPTFADTPFRTVQDLYRMCKDAQQDYICIGYVSGVGELMQIIAAEYPDVKEFAICGNPTNGAMMQAFKNWTEKNPREWDTGKLVGVVAALRENWGCH